MSMNHLAPADKFITEIEAADGLWLVDWTDEKPLLKYYRSLYTTNFRSNLGVAEFTLDFDSIVAPLNNISATALYFIINDTTIIQYQDNSFSPYLGDPKELRANTFFSSIQAQNDFPEILITTTSPAIITYQNRFLLLALPILIMVFTLLYFLLTKSITDRLVALEIHISQTKTDNLKSFKSDYKDEIGIVINAYNNLVTQTNTLIHENFLVTLKKKEADYYALQSQIKPHFLYNILENIRMSAETHHDSETADMLTALGKYMRYSLNISHHSISLTDELYSAKNYLQIHKIRMKEKIDVEIGVFTETTDVFVPRFLLQPLIENSVLHGYCLERQLQIRIVVKDATGKPDFVVLELIDNGNGITKERLSELQDMIRQEKSTDINHIGLLSVSNRINTIYNDNESSHFFIESCEGNGCKITLLLKRGKPHHENINC